MPLLTKLPVNEKILVALAVIIAVGAAGALCLFFSFPVETVAVEVTETAPSELNLPDIRDTGEVWVELIEGADNTIDVASLILESPYSSNWTLDNIYRSLTDAAENRGVAVRILVDGTYASSMANDLKQYSGISARYWTGEGVLHSKYMIVDRETVSVGSTNLSSYAMGGGGDGNREVNVTIGNEKIAETYTHIFDTGWQQAGGEPGGAGYVWDEEWLVPVADGAGSEAVSTVGAFKDLFDRAKERVWFYMYIYAGAPPELENSIIAAAERGVEVKLLVDSHSEEGWAQKLEELQLAGVEVSVIDHPFTAHPKIIIADDEWVYVGSSNIHPEWMLEGREVGVMVNSPDAAGELRDIFLMDWISTCTRSL